MCYLLVIAVAESAAEAVRRRHGAHGAHIATTTNPSLLTIAGVGRTPLVITIDGCSCGLYRDPATPPPKDRRIAAEAKYHKLGWSQAKIDRALESMPTPKEIRLGLDPRIVTLVRTLVLEYGEVSLWVQWCDGAFETVTFRITTRTGCSLDELPDRAERLAPDTVLAVTPTRA